jgi:signal transduction histidine kinase
MFTPASSPSGRLTRGVLGLPDAPGPAHHFRAGEVLFAAGDPGDGFYIIDQGRVQVFAAADGGEPRLLATLGPGETVGEMAVVDDGPRSATARAETDTDARHVTREQLLRLFDERPAIALEFIREFSIRMRALNQKYLDDVLQAERLAIVGRFARTIVHDFKSPLAVIGLAAELGCSDRTSPAMRQKAQQRITEQVDRMANMLQELIEFTKPSGQQLLLAPVDFTRYLTTWAEEARPDLTERRVDLLLELTPPLAEVAVDARRISRLLHNLVANAVDEMPDGGTVVLRARREAATLRMEVEDTGPGIAPEIEPALFTPFATYGKPHGTGLGLTICKKIAEDHRGKIWAAAREPGRGAKFIFTLPVEF